MVEKEDKVYAEPITHLDSFKFNARVADVFENMIERSVPGYQLILDMIGLLTEQFSQPDTNCFDLGCSLGASTLKIRQHLNASCHVIGVDISSEMVERCKINTERDHSQASIEIRNEDLRDTRIANASVVVMNFTLQFIPNADRDATIKNIASGIVDDGILILCEKIKFAEAGQQDRFNNLHQSFKRLKGYSDLEIAQKRAALENVLVSNTADEHKRRLLRSGFKEVEQIIQCFNFVAFLAIK